MRTILAGIACVFLFGCSSFSTNTFRAEQTAVNVAYTAYVGWTNYLNQYPFDPATVDRVKEARLKFAATVGTVESLRAAYETNSSVKPQLQATLTTLSDQSSNLVWLISYLKGVPTK